MIHLAKKIAIKGRITLLSGLHIGGNNSSIEIGNVDATVIRNPISGQPYIPGSSLKGKIRSLLEQQAGIFSKGAVPHGPSEDDSHKIVRFFGSAKGSNNNIPSKIIVRDCKIIDPNKVLLNLNTTDLPYTEIKTEVVIDRITSAANPRQLERVPAGVEFAMEIVLNVWENHTYFITQEEMLSSLFRGFYLLESDYLGGKGSRGSGQVKIGLEKITSRQRSFSDGIDEEDLSGIIPDNLKYDPIYAAEIYGYQV